MLMEMENKKKKFKLYKTLIFVIIISVLCFIFYINIIKAKPKGDFSIISFGNNDKQCLVQKTELNKENIIKEYQEYENIKLDKPVEIKKISQEELKSKIKNSVNKKYFDFGIAFDEKFNTFLLKEEINSNNLIDYEKYKLQLNEMNEYLQSQGKEQIQTIPEEIFIFKTESYYYENSQWIKLSTQNAYDLREFDSSTQSLEEKIKLASERLSSLENYDGRYIYGLETNTSEYISGYNILRHAGTTWSQILAYKENPNEQLKENIESAIEYLVDNYIIVYNDKINYVVENDEIKLGGNALTLLMLSEYKQVFNDDKYLELSAKISNGILAMQNEDGSFNHVYNTDFTIKEKIRTVYYDGESIFALMKYYQCLNKEEIYNAVTKAIDYLIEQDYTKYADHWIAYGVSEYIKYNHENKYIEFALNNYTKNKYYINSITIFNPTSVEMILATYKTYLYVKEIDTNNEILQRFNIDDLKESINKRINSLYSYYIYPEVAMYLKAPNEVIYGFHNIEYRMRIDDIQHSLAATILYKEIGTY